MVNQPRSLTKAKRMGPYNGAFMRHALDVSIYPPFHDFLDRTLALDLPIFVILKSHFESYMNHSAIGTWLNRRLRKVHAPETLQDDLLVEVLDGFHGLSQEHM
ncbi:hypothetical protein PG999_014192 [Apiospora kogelbergensis]|uniref:Uncharacterized protein n=1 Tax=Apiospora kogelbergensis TaxID=1337665 RepID=A0AAW0QGI4_9PEZI